jgi:outer membrane protein TolC
MSKMFVIHIFVYIAFGYAQVSNNKIQLSLKAAIDTALTNNPEVIASFKEIEASEGQILQAGRLENAELSFEANEIPSGFDFGDTGEFDLNFNQPIEFFGKRSTRIKQEYKKEVQNYIMDVKKLIFSG